MKNLFEEDKKIEQAITITKVLKVLNMDKDLHERILVDAINQGSTAKWQETANQLNDEIENNERTLEQLQSYIAVGYPQCMHTNASSVIDVYNKKVADYKRSWSVWMEDCKIATDLTWSQANYIKDDWIANGHKDVQVQRVRL
jgi:hypothetical protein